MRKVLFTGWGTRDTHAGPSNLRYGPDNWYLRHRRLLAASAARSAASTSVSARASIASSSSRSKTGDVNVTKMEFLRNTNNNSWGVGFSEEGLLFGSTANGCASVYMPIPNRYYEKVRGWSSTVLQSIIAEQQILPDHRQNSAGRLPRRLHGRRGPRAVHGPAYPQEYWNRTAFVSDPTGHLTATFTASTRTARDFTARYGWNLLASDDEWIAPIAAEVGPDGDVWMIDWYNFIVQHNPTPPGFQHGQGRRLRDRSARQEARPDLSPRAKGQKAEASSRWRTRRRRELVAALKNDEHVLAAARPAAADRARHADGAITEIAELVDDQSVDAIGLNVGAIDALWTLARARRLRRQDPRGGQQWLAQVALAHPSAGVRRTRSRVVPRQPSTADSR